MATPEHARPSAPASQDVPKSAKELLSEIFDQFHNFDARDECTHHLNEAISEKTANFAVRFGVDEAKIAINLPVQALQILLQVQAERKEDKVTWINIWSPGKNRPIVDAIANKYKFSTRLRETITSWDSARRLVTHSLADQSPAKSAYASSRAADIGVPRLRRGKTFHHRTIDPEKGLARDRGAERRTAALEDEAKGFHKEDLDMYRWIQSQYHYTTIDHGPSFICIGANWLHQRVRSGKESNEPDNIYKTPQSFVPPKHWAWYILTNEGTVISIHEDPSYEMKNNMDTPGQQAEELASMRKNTRDLLHQLSEPGMDEYKRKVSAQKGVRSDLLQANQDQLGPLPSSITTYPESSLLIDASANLFYYLFEDYTATTSILSESSRILAQVTHDVLHITDRKNKDKDSSDIIKLLYARSKDLRQLKHLFVSYEDLVRSIMALGTDTTSDEKDSPALLSLSAAGGPARGVKLSQRAFDRFDRLSIRMRLLMLDAIDEYLAEKASLSDTYFNLINLKDSQATSKLNRSASLLAKLSVFFLPVSFMTSYFSVQIPELTNNYTAKTYWVCFAVIATMSFISVFFFSKLLMVASDVLDEQVANFQRRVGRSMVNLFSRKRTAPGQGQSGGGIDDDGSRKRSEED
ncbi:putative adp-ribosylation factor protein [Mycena sanguinolenta]|uniref:Putative adp-ribosylation factor protein n=1 Tax=Mycena sanguinolenta TaxID=230812 RepID=A0A8H6Z3U7_9AGAR|nr:putative adp-ribosylation factor protein [Mycena sanguinolenta]